jgi:hypothetical protein
MALPLAHVGHVLVELPVFLGPVLVVCGWIAWVTHRDRRHEREEAAAGGEGAAADPQRAAADSAGPAADGYVRAAKEDVAPAADRVEPRA